MPNNLKDLFTLSLTNGGLGNIQSTIQESPSTQAYYQVAAQDNPDYAQMNADIRRHGDLDRQRFNLTMQAIAPGLANTYDERRENDKFNKLMKIEKEIRALNHRYTKELKDIDNQNSLYKLFYTNKLKRDNLAEDRVYEEKLKNKESLINDYNNGIGYINKMPYPTALSNRMDNTQLELNPYVRNRIDTINDLSNKYNNSNDRLERARIISQIKALNNLDYTYGIGNFIPDKSKDAYNNLIKEYDDLISKIINEDFKNSLGYLGSFVDNVYANSEIGNKLDNLFLTDEQLDQQMFDRNLNNDLKQLALQKRNEYIERANRIKEQIDTLPYNSVFDKYKQDGFMGAIDNINDYLTSNGKNPLVKYKDEISDYIYRNNMHNIPMNIHNNPMINYIRNDIIRRMSEYQDALGDFNGAYDLMLFRSPDRFNEFLLANPTTRKAIRIYYDDSTGSIVGNEIDFGNPLR